MCLPLSPDRDGIEAILRAPRVLLYLSVDWSVPERASRRAFLDAVDVLNEESALQDFKIYVIDDESDGGRELMARLGFARAHVTFTLGSGSLVWIEAGRRVDDEVAAKRLGTPGIIARTFARWAKDVP